MTTAKCAYLLGMGEKPRRWERPLLFFAAIFTADLVWLVIAPSIITKNEHHSLELWNVPPAWTWLEFLLGNLLLAVLAAVSFRLIRNVFAIAPLALANGLLWSVLSYISYLAQATAGATPFWDSSRLWNFVFNVLWALFLFALLELALRSVKNLLLALGFAAVGHSLLMVVIITLVGRIFFERPFAFSERLLYLPFNLLGGLLLALTLYAGLRLTSGRAPLDEALGAPRVSKGFYLGTLATIYAVSLIVSVAVIVLILTGVWTLKQFSEITPVFLLLGVASLPVLYAIVVFCLLIHKMWQAIQDGHARTTPGRAVGALFIPFYNLYWAFQVFPGFATDYNAFAERHALAVPRLSTGIFTAYAIICILAAIPYLGLLFVPAGYVVLLVMVARICDAVNALPDASLAAERSA